MFSAIISKYRSPASVSATRRPAFAISDVPRWTSRAAICWLTAEGVTPKS